MGVCIIDGEACYPCNFEYHCFLVFVLAELLNYGDVNDDITIWCSLGFPKIM